MKFWDASALVPLLIAEASTPRMLELASEDPSLLVWWGARIECQSALSRIERVAAYPAAAMTGAHARLAQLSADWDEVDPNELVREAASGSFVCIRCGPRTRCNWRQLSWRRIGGRHHLIS